MHRPCLVALATLSVGLGGCATMKGSAESSFTARHPECGSTNVKERADLSTKLASPSPDDHVYEVSGCNMDEIFTCTESHWAFHSCAHSNGTCGGWVPSDCSTVPWPSDSSPYAPAPAAATGYALTAPPRGAAGFDLGVTPDAAQKRCVDSGKTWSPRDGGFECSGPAADVGFDAKVRFGLCDKLICDISVVAPETPAWVHQYAELRTLLSQKYGGNLWTPPPDENEASCEGDALRGCVLAGRYKVETLWRWQTGESVDLEVAKDPADPQHLQVRIGYHGQSVAGGTLRAGAL